MIINLIFIFLNVLFYSINAKQETKFTSTASYIIQDADLSSKDYEEPDYSRLEAAIQSNDMPLSTDDTHIKWITSAELIELLNYFNLQTTKSTVPQTIIIDTRNSNEYNGWKSFKNIYLSLNFNQTGLLPLYDMKNGRVNDAHNFDADWLHLFDPNTLKGLIAERLGLRLKPDDETSNIPIILYDTQKSRLEKVKSYLTEHFTINLIYLCQLEDEELSNFILKSNTTGNLFFQEPFYDMLLSAEVLNAILRPYNESYVVRVKPITEYKLFDVSKGGPEKSYENSHIPTAFHLSIDNLEEKNSIRKNRTELAKVFLNYGLAPNNTEMIILYGNPDPMASYRAALIMKWMGIRDVHILNGGFRSWLIKDLPIETFSNKPVAIKTDLNQHIKSFEDQSFFAQNPITYIVDQNYVSDLVKNHDVFQEQYLLVDIRTYEEHIGETSGYSKAKSKGRIPTSLWGKAGTAPDQLEDYRNPDLTMRSGVEILKMWDDLGIDYKFKHLILYCGNGWRSSEVMFYAELMGLYKISLYDGGWLDWSSNSNNTFQLGPSSDNDSISFETRFTPETTPLTTITTKPTENKSHKTSLVQQKITQSPAIPTLTTTASKKSNVTALVHKQSSKQTTAYNSADFIHKNQFDAVTADPNAASIQNSKFFINYLSFIFVFVLVKIF